MAPTRRRFLLAAVAGAVVAAGGAPDGSAFLVRRDSKGKEVAWKITSPAANVVDGKITFYVDKAGVPDVTGEEFAGAVRNALGAWETQPHSAVAFAEDTARATTLKTSTDRINRFGFTDGVLPPFAFAAAFTATTNGAITDVDVVFNPNLEWSVQFPGNAEKADIQGVAVHEWGHGLGFDHVPLRRASMFFAASLGAVSLRSVETDDAAAAGVMYPEESFASDLGTIRGTVDVPGTTDDRGVQVTAIDYLTNLPAASGLSLPDGSYAVRGLPPGVYRLVASPIGTTNVSIGVYSSFWAGTITDLLPAVHPGSEGAGNTGVFLVDAGEEITGVNFALGASGDAFEPNESRAASAPIAPGQSVAGRLDAFSDIDYFSFTASTGDRISILVHAQQIGSELDPRMFLQNSTGTNLAQSTNISNGVTSAEGADADCRILDFVIPSDGTYHVRLEPQQGPDPDVAEDYFYVLTLVEGGGPPSPYTSTLEASHAIRDADGVSTIDLVFTPRALTGGLSGEGLAVTFDLVADGDDDALLSPVVDQLDGTYTATLVAPTSASADAVNARVDGTVLATASVEWLGDAAFAASDFAATPRRVRADGSAVSTVVLVPRDARGLALGSGRTVVLSLDAAPTGTSVGGTIDQEDGGYGALLEAGTVRGTAAVAATVDGEDLGGTLAVGLGFPLGEVVDENAAILAAATGLPTKAVAKAAAARAALDAVSGLDPASSADAILVGAKKAAKAVEVAVKKGAASLLPVATELAEAARETALDALAEREPFADETKEIAAVAKGESLVASGDALLAAGKRSAAVGKYRAALKQALKIVE